MLGCSAPKNPRTDSLALIATFATRRDLVSPMAEENSDLSKLLGREELLVVILSRSTTELHETSMNEDLDGQRRVTRLHVGRSVDIGEERVLRW